MEPTPSSRKNDFGREHELAAQLARFRLDMLAKEVGSTAARGRGLAEMRWSQRAVAARAGFSSANLCQYERQRVTPRSFEIWERWARALGLAFMAQIAAAALGSPATARPPTRALSLHGGASLNTPR